MMVLAGGDGRAADVVMRKSTDKPAAGEITSVTQTEVIVKPKVGAEISVPANDIDHVDYDAAPPSLRLGRSQERGGQFEAALESYADASSKSATGNPHLRAEIEFLVARTNAKAALGDPEKLPAAAEGLSSFLSRHKEHYRHYDAQLLLGEVLLAANDVTGAESAFSTVAAAPWPDMQMSGKMGRARILFRQGDAAGAQQVFDEVVAGATGNDSATAARRLEAMLGQAQCLRAQGRHADAIGVFAGIVREAREDDSRLQAEAYVGQGEAYLAEGNHLKEAITRFLIVDVVPSLAQYGDLHAQALYQLAQLWPQVGQPIRGAEASAKLEQEYPNSEWAKKLRGQ